MKQQKQNRNKLNVQQAQNNVEFANEQNFNQQQNQQQNQQNQQQNQNQQFNN